LNAKPLFAVYTLGRGSSTTAGLNALAASFHPTSIRSTGVGWALGVGRIGSIAGPLVAGVFGWLVILLGNQIKVHASPYNWDPVIERSGAKEEVPV
jgi:hypothetical protein